MTTRRNMGEACAAQPVGARTMIGRFRPSPRTRIIGRFVGAPVWCLAAAEIAGEDKGEPKKRKCPAHRGPGAVSMRQVPLGGEQQGPALNGAPVALEELP